MQNMVCHYKIFTRCANKNWLCFSFIYTSPTIFSTRQSFYAYLFLVRTEYGRSILRAHIVSLLVQSSGIVEHEEVLHKIFVGLLVAVELQVVHFHVLCLSRAHLHGEESIMKHSTIVCKALFVAIQLVTSL